MRINRIEINNFRNYYGKHEFNLDKSITILYGDNGYGKSTFFDAIEWCINNEIERFRVQDGNYTFSNYDCLNNFAKDDENPSCYVTLYYEDYRLHRKYSLNTNHTAVYLYKYINESNSEVLIAQGQKNVEQEIYKYKERKNNLGAKLIKQSYVLSQDQITNFIRSNPKDRFDSLTSIMGTNKITNFIDNLKVTCSFMQNIHSKLENDFQNNNKLRAERVNDRIEYQKLKSEIENLVIKLNTIEDTKINDDFYSNLESVKDYLNNVNKELAERNQNMNILEKIPSKFLNLNHLQKAKDESEEEIERLLNLLKKVEERLTVTKNEKQRVSSSFQKIKENEGINEKIKIKKDELNAIQLELQEINPLNSTDEELQSKLKISRKQLYSVEFTLKYIEEYQKAKYAQKEKPALIQSYEKEVGKFEMKIRSRIKLLHSIKKSLDKNNGNTSLQGLVQYLKGIADYVKINDINDECPVCSAPIEDNLENRINHNIMFHSNKITDVEVLLVKGFEIQERRQKELEFYKQNLRSFQQKILDAKQSYEGAINLIDNISSNTQFNNELFNSHKNDLINLRDKSNKEVEFLEGLIKKKTIFIEMENSFLDILTTVNLDKDEVETENSLEFKGEYLNRNIERLSRLMIKVDEKISRIKKERDAVSFQLSQFESKGLKIELNQNFSEIINHQFKYIKNLNEDKALLESIRELIIKRNEKIESIKSLEKYERNISIINIEKEKWNSKLVELEAYIAYLTNEVGEQALDFLNYPSSKIQQYYRYLNPTPNINGDIKFITDNSDETKRGLLITIPYKKSNGEYEYMNARYTLSSAQLNTLAISIFLVTNDSQDIGVFDFVAIDDPIQNMDDINQYTMCDILGDIKKQLLFSTHDIEFLKLFVKKNEHKKEDIRVYFLDTPNTKEGRVKEVTF